MTSIYIAKLGLITRKTNIGAQKIDGSILETYKMVIAGFLIQDRLEKIWFFKETFLLANTSIEVILGMLFLTFLDINIWFVEKELTWRSYKTVEALLTTKKVELINKKKIWNYCCGWESQDFCCRHGLYYGNHVYISS